MGVASTWQAPLEGWGPVLADELLQMSDRAMYRAKNNGRNRAEAWEPAEAH
jgi:PleD family two-component response regulator